MTTSLRLILFDLDGTLLDTAPDMVGALNRLCVEQGGMALPYEDVRPLVSHGSGRLVKFAFPDAVADADRFALLQARYLQIYREHLSAQTRLFDGMDQALADIAARCLLCGIVTNKPGWLTEPLLEALQLSARFTCVISGDTLSSRKPHPAPMLHAAKLAGVAPGDCIYVGDAERDVQAAHAAGMQALVAAYGYLEPSEDWRAWHADGAIDTPRDLMPWLLASGRL